MGPRQHYLTSCFVARGATNVPTIRAGMDQHVATSSLTARTGEPNASVLKVYRAGFVKESIVRSLRPIFYSDRDTPDKSTKPGTSLHKLFIIHSGWGCPG